ncbi:MAG: 50S ribosomal protein L24 [Candidatus Pacebacteria bacterium]|nr:50S ribosomal protein L24 [Candidatus Paceibacterota bacterium]
MKIKKGDNIIVIAGKNKGEKGQVTKVISETNRLLVSGVNKVKKHLKAKSKDTKGSMIEIEASINASNVMVVDPKTGKATRIGKKKIGDKNVRIAKKSGQELK